MQLHIYAAVGLALITAPVLAFLFTGRDVAITMNSVKTDITQ